MAEQKNTKRAPMAVQIAGGLIAIIIIAVIAINIANNKNNSQKMSIQEAQAKCMLMNEWGQVNEIGKPFSQEVIEEAERFCLSQWDSPEREKDFLNFIPKDWEVMKGKELNGYTLQQLYDENKNSSK